MGTISCLNRPNVSETLIPCFELVGIAELKEEKVLRLCELPLWGESHHLHFGHSIRFDARYFTMQEYSVHIELVVI